jgi:hypothetical protein
MPKVAYSIREFDRRRQELENDGFDCVEWHLGHVTEFVRGLKPVNNDRVIIAQFVRRFETAD